MARHLPPRLRLLAPDLRGHGGSGHAEAGRYEVRDFVSDAKRLLDAQAVNAPFVVVGHSLGGAVAAALAEAEGTRCRGVVVVDAAVDPASPVLPRILEHIASRPQTFSSLEDALAYAPRSWPLAREEVLRVTVPPQLAQRSDGRWHWRTDSTLLDVPLWQRWTSGLASGLPRILQPRLVVRAERGFVDDEDADRLGRQGVDVVMVKGAGHVVHEDAPEIFARILEGFLTKHAGTLRTGT